MGYHLPASNPALSYPSAGRAFSIHESLKLPPIDLEMLELDKSSNSKEYPIR